MSTAFEVAGEPPEKEKKKEKPKSELLTGPQIEKRLRELIEGGGELMEEVMGDQFCGYVLRERAAPLGAAYGKLAQRNETWRRMLSGLLTTSEVAEAVILTVGTVGPIAAHHGWLPANLGGVFMFGLTPPAGDDGPAKQPQRAEQPAASYPSSGVGPAPPEPEHGDQGRGGD